MLMLVGLVFFLCLMAVACLIALAWGVRALWARTHGPARGAHEHGCHEPFAGWQTVYRSGPSGWRNRRAMPTPEWMGVKPAGVAAFCLVAAM
jgi:hypothetical protein